MSIHGTGGRFKMVIFSRHWRTTIRDYIVLAWGSLCIHTETDEVELPQLYHM